MLFRSFLPETTIFGENSTQILRADYLGDPNRISPVADPNITSQQQRLQQALTIKQAAMSTPGYNIPEVEKNFLQALHVDGWEVMYPGPEKIKPPMNPKVQIEQLKQQTKMAELQLMQQQFVAELMEERRLKIGRAHV